MKAKPDPRLVFLDLETTGLLPGDDVVLEIGIVITDVRFKVLETWATTIQTPDALDRIHSAYVRKMHTESGLLADLPSGVRCVTDAEVEAIKMLKHAGFKEGTATLAGYCPHFDRSFLHRHMPVLDAFFDYRMIDVSTLRGMARRLVDADIDEKLRTAFGDTKHRTIADCVAALNELEFYVRNFLDLDGLRKAMQDQRV